MLHSVQTDCRCRLSPWRPGISFLYCVIRNLLAACPAPVLAAVDTAPVPATRVTPPPDRLRSWVGSSGSRIRYIGAGETHRNQTGAQNQT
ncbi:uncharacterized protein BDZ83DRAFT_624666 [Colletotrichum acutatum]|uniref:Uncharacterized protein n=1 Tax=Glomerella acutata TaxID=27357 RepID=A0AAD8UL46_GLOAC|nr:uncharacterized protein BDZ83DRAFT_624666 [Colletotrichum acutatum]KAK1723935.1 hypothetical protein BDZ83DRAFT_624666 [Colletotrichum acutatum]